MRLYLDDIWSVNWSPAGQALAFKALLNQGRLIEFCSSANSGVYADILVKDDEDEDAIEEETRDLIVDAFDAVGRH